MTAAKSRATLLILFVLGLVPRVAAGAAPKGAQPADAWPEITAAEKGFTRVPDDPDADAVVLLKSRDGRIGQVADDTVNTLHYFWRMKILNERGKRYGEVHLRAQKYSRVDAIEARTIKPDGTVVPVPPDQIFEKVVLQRGNARITEKVFNFPALEPGAIIEYRYTRRDNFLLFLDPYYFAGEEFTVRSHISQGFLGPTSYSILCDLCPPVQPTVGEWRNANQKGQLYTLDLVNLPGYRDEAMMPPERETSPRLEMVLNTWKGRFSEQLGRADRIFIDWDSVARWMLADYGKVIAKGQSDLAPVVQGWISGASDPAEKIKVVLRHVQDDFRYIPWNAVIGYCRPIDVILKDKTADNEEKAVLLLAALKTIGVEGDPVLVVGKDVGSLNPRFFSMAQFSHVMVALAGTGDARQFLDPTVSYAPFGFVPWRDSGANALPLHANTAQVLDLPAKNEVSLTRYRINVKPGRDGRADVDLQAEFQGEDAIDLRDELTPASQAGRETWTKEWLERRRPGSTLASMSLENLEDVAKPLLLKLTFQAPGLVTVADEAMLVHGCIVSCYETNPLSRAVREHPFYIDRGWNTEENVMIEPPPGYEAASMPQATAARSSLAAMNLSCLPYGEGGARCTRQFSARRNRWPASEHAAARAMYDKIVQGDRTVIAFKAKAAGTN
jgi:Domain of Unknown Function with PDB structure (DUF3857)